MAGLTEFIDVKQLDGNAEFTLTGSFFQQQYAHTCTRDYAEYFDQKKHTHTHQKKQTSSATPLYTLATCTPIHTPLTINSTQ